MYHCKKQIAEIRLETLIEVYEACQNLFNMDAYLRKQIHNAQNDVYASLAPDVCNCNVGCGDAHAAQCAVWRET